MYKYLIKFFCVLIVLVSCTNPQNKRVIKGVIVNNLDQTETIKKTKVSFLNDAEVEKLIQSNNPIFMSFWLGMTEKESIEIIRYLIEKNKIFGTTNGEQLSRYNIKSPVFKKIGGGYSVGESLNLYFYLTPNIESIKCEIELNYDDTEKLESINLLIIENTNLEQSNDIINLYTTKYGKPKFRNDQGTVKDIFPCEIYNRYSFEKDTKLIEITYQSKCNVFGDEYSPNQIHINYTDKEIRDKKNKVFFKHLENESKKINKKIQESLESI
jgi:hypothetical protein